MTDTSQDQRAIVNFRGSRHHAHDSLEGYKVSNTYIPSTSSLITLLSYSPKRSYGTMYVESAVQKLHVNKRIASLPRLPPKQKSRWSWIWSRGAKEVACCACELTTSKIGKRSHDEGRLWKVVQIQRSTSDVSVVQHHPNHGTARSAFSC